MSAIKAVDNNEEIEKVLNGVKIPPQPKVLIELRQQAAHGFPNLKNVASIISTDVGLSASVLKIINCPFYGLSKPISSIQQAVMLLGANNLMNIVTSASLRQSVKGKACISIENFWAKATDIANLCMGIARYCHFNKVDDYYALGLFHDSGIVLLAQKFSNYKEVQAESNTKKRSLTEVEDEFFQTDHATIGYYLSKSWHLPDSVTETIRDHHNLDRVFLPDHENDERNGMMGVLRMATNIHYSATRVSTEPDWKIIGYEVLEYMQISENDYEDMIMDMADRLEKSRQ